MTMAMAAQGRRTGRWLAAAAFAGILTTLAAGCANQHPGGASADTMATPSDDTDQRRRARIRLELASSYYEEGKTEVALDEVKQVLVLDPTFGEAYNLRGLVYLRLGDPVQAEDNFRRAVVLNPRDGDAHHNYGWLQCQRGRYPEAARSFQQALAIPLYSGRSKTFLAMGVCDARAGLMADAERNLLRAYELDAANPVAGYNLSRVLYQRGDFQRAQFYIRRLNNSELANAESLWLGIKVENRMNDSQAMAQLSEQLRKRYPQSRERGSLDRRAFDE
jgi:type IV pilus assembly protein PilF